MCYCQTLNHRAFSLWHSNTNFKAGVNICSLYHRISGCCNYGNLHGVSQFSSPEGFFSERGRRVWYPGLCTTSNSKADWSRLYTKERWPQTPSGGGIASGAERAFGTNDTACLPDRMRGIQWCSGDYALFLYLRLFEGFYTKPRSSGIWCIAENAKYWLQAAERKKIIPWSRHKHVLLGRR